ncbi:MAG: shikimate dehydrogenase [Gammaproteobacteria bacterium]
MPRWFTEHHPPGRYFCVVGSPIAHSRSPQIHAAFARQFGIELIYERVEVAPGDLAGAVAEFHHAGGRGMNVTVPLKEEAWGLAAVLSPRARLAGAANTLWFEAGQLAADNTDGVGLVRDLVVNHGIALAGRDILLLGAGGAARGVLPVLLEAGPARVTISNRSPARARTLADAFSAHAAVRCLDWGEAPSAPPDLVINATSLSLHGEVPPLASDAVGPDTVCYDMVYAPTGTPFTRWAASHGARLAVDGLGMLVEQAGAAFEIWHGVAPRTAAVIEALRQDG